MTRSRTPSPPTKRSASARAAPPWLMAMALGLIAFAVYTRALSNDFVWYDDNEYVTANQRVQQGLTIENIGWAFTTTSVANWHPLTWISHMLDVEMWGLRAAGHHLTSVVLHAINTSLLFGVLWLMTGAWWRSALVAALFAVHPLHVESVAWVAERKDVLSTFFGLLALIAYVWYVKRPDFWCYAVVACAFACSLMSKPMLVTLPFALLLLDWWPLQRLALKDGARVGRVLIEKVPLLALSIASSVITIIAQKSGGTMQALESLPLTDRVANAIVAYATYVAKTVWPMNLAVIYPLKPPATAAVIVSLTALLAISAFVVARSRSRPALLVGWLWFLGTLVPVIGLVQVGSQSMADRYMYVPIIGLFLMAIWGLPQLSTAAGTLNRAVAIGSVAVLGALGAVTIAQIGHWRNGQSLFAQALRVTHDNYLALDLLGIALYRAGRIDESIEHFQRSIAVRSDYASPYNNLGNAYLAKSQFADAEQQYRKALALDPRDVAVQSNLGAALLRQGKMEQAIEQLKNVLQTRPDHVEALVNLGSALLQVGRTDEGIAYLKRAVAVAPNLPLAHANIGLAYWNQQNAPQAILHLGEALRLQPDLVELRVTLGAALAADHRYVEAIAQFETVLRHNPQHALARQGLQQARKQLHPQGGSE